MTMQGVDIIGVVGAALILAAYFMATTKRWDTHSLPYQLTNLGGASGLIVYSFSKTAYVHVVINAVWAVVAVVGLVLVVKPRKRRVRRK